MDLTSSGALRRGLCAVAVAATLPYLTLKLLWLCGSTVGFTGQADLSIGADALWVANLVTFGMDAVALLLALAFVRPWGRRVPVGLLVFPMWVATGLLGSIMLELPLIFGAELVLGGEPPATQQEWLYPWVFVLVYGGFVLQGLALIAGFVLHARERWAGLLGSRIGDLPRTATLRLQQVLSCVAAGLALPVAAAKLYWALGGDFGLPSAFLDGPQRPQRIIAGVTGLLLLAAGAAFLRLTFRLGPDRPLRPTLVTAWLAAGSVFAWGSFTLFVDSLRTEVPSAADAVPPIASLVTAGQAGAGLLLLVVGAVALLEHASARADVESAG
ncbi:MULTISPECIES: DUF3995 domain-containing protein [unclassified Kitasatospora]|uniref:DUF3995 domain-containing protein n=1 Tax=unclassified Kitasatospora TaxID=2633591 RepID=UPI00070A446E|nr:MULTISPECIES: DUF3995 domain-containing protein [unclassified Kitasatospora]KQV21768.1 hypothetical protein ASC99_18945 [Kitasatospora sp. Root107]KRB75439.1 hypothetical protein ASE03_15810 [Kitasatospora sp. Root187]